MKFRWHFAAFLCLCLSVQNLFPGSCRAEGEDDPLWNKPSYEKKIIQVGQRILAANGIKERIAFYYVNKDIRNADARRWYSPNTIRVFKDLTDVISSDDELAAVLSHEIAHIINRHTRKAYLTKTPIILGTIVLAGAATFATGGVAAPVAVGLGGKALSRPIDRGMETDADLTGLNLMVKAGYNPLAMETLMTKMTGDAGVVTSFFSTHPLGTKRIAHIHEAIQKKYPQFLTEELANNPLPGSPYQFQPKEGKPEAKENLVQNDEPEKGAATKEPISPEKQALYDRLEQLAHPEKPKSTPAPSGSPEAITALTVAEEPEAQAAQLPKEQESKTSPLKPAPQKLVYSAPASTLKKAPKEQKYSAQTATRTSNDNRQKEANKEELPVALRLLELNSYQQNALKLIAQRHYMERKELETYYPDWEADLFNNMLNGLVTGNLIRIVGGDSADQGYVLTDAASSVLENQKK